MQTIVKEGFSVSKRKESSIELLIFRGYFRKFAPARHGMYTLVDDVMFGHIRQWPFKCTPEHEFVNFRGK